MPKYCQRKNMNLKMMFIVNHSLKMGKGKIAAQVAHAALGIYQTNIENKNLDTISKWQDTGSAKIVCKVTNEREMNNIKIAADKLGILNHTVIDAGKTQIESGSQTVLVLGPDFENRLKQITGHLKLL